MELLTARLEDAPWYSIWTPGHRSAAFSIAAAVALRGSGPLGFGQTLGVMLLGEAGRVKQASLSVVVDNGSDIDGWSTVRR
ncbi:hypothetical protein VTH06DRAFT_2407 [Thermothelomyces fergusii]